MSEALLERAAAVLGSVADPIVFVGGATIHLWITEPGAPPARTTDDVDVICEVAGYGNYQLLADRLREAGLHEALNEAVTCRWRDPATGLAIDVMPTDEAVLGFSNRWYPRAVETAVERSLPSGRAIRAARPPVLVATKLAAWRGRGRGDALRSLDVHDVVALFNGRPELGTELATEEADLRMYVAAELEALGAEPYFDYVIQDAVSTYGSAAPARATIVREDPGSRGAHRLSERAT